MQQGPSELEKIGTVGTTSGGRGYTSPPPFPAQMHGIVGGFFGETIDAILLASKLAIDALWQFLDHILQLSRL